MQTITGITGPATHYHLPLGASLTVISGAWRARGGRARVNKRLSVCLLLIEGAIG